MAKSRLTFGQKLMGLREEHLGVHLDDSLYYVGAYFPYKLQGDDVYRFEVALLRGTVIQITPGWQEEFICRCDEVIMSLQSNFEKITGKTPFWLVGHNYGARARDLYPKEEDAIKGYKSTLLKTRFFFEGLVAGQPQNQLPTIMAQLESLPL